MTPTVLTSDSVFHGATPTPKQLSRTHEVVELEQLIRSVKNGTCTSSTIRRLLRISRKFPSGDYHSVDSAQVWEQFAQPLVDALCSRLEEDAAVCAVNARTRAPKKIVFCYLSSYVNRRPLTYMELKGRYSRFSLNADQTGHLKFLAQPMPR
jgi:hypothetical protein